MQSPVIVEVTDGVATLRIARPEASNAIDLPTARALVEAIDTVAVNNKVRAVLVAGVGRRFCAGGDVSAMVGALDRPAYLAELASTLDRALVALDALTKPVVAAVQGAVAGAGLAIMLSCDLVVADARTRFLSAYAGVGLTPDCGLSWLLPRAVGQQRALQLLLLPHALDAAKAQEWGMVTETVAHDPFDRAEELAQCLARGPAFAHGQARRLVRSSWDVDRATTGRDEAATIARAVLEPSAADALSSFATR